ncbi:L-alanine-DL-glutamate epimerase [Methylomagnum ishizawai]|uniref:Dipeptide epimerase n=1 Tax=Methylomagnum ishizawai TaxID=1760988 RepID=A0A1Y6CY68_9GAMM|nr:N-acetyl-D-Glu racemase DgcA [Methylomagnum ishizawai]SMF95301.1 L-alanine-DL-glutamate epimerase [Methylomagnum ishizawai]
MRQITIQRETWPLRGVFRIARGGNSEITVVVVEIREGAVRGRGECRPYPRYGETPAAVIGAITALVPALAAGLEREELLTRIPPGAARNAIDCALWDLAAQRAGQPVWRLAGLPPPAPLTTAYTLSVDTPEQVAATARAQAARPLLKLKLAGGDDLERVAAVRTHAPAARLIVDANEAWTLADYHRFMPELARLGVELVEQPFPAGADAALADLPRPVPVCADESCHDSASLAQLRGRYDVLNIKLDKTGGLTEALGMQALARAEGFKIMVGCMVATSLAMAPALLLAQGADYVDLDGPLLLAKDREPGLRYEGSRVFPAEAAVWG